jgi:hypothetical protein
MVALATGMRFIEPLLLVVCGILGMSGMIIARKPSAKELINKLTPYQAFLGVGLLVWSIYWFLHIGPRLFFKLPTAGFAGLVGFVAIIAGILLGFFFGMPQVAKWIPGESSAETKALELSRKLAPFLTLLGAIGFACGLLGLYYAARL